MRRLARHPLTLCSALSLLLCVAVGVLWVRSGPIDERVEVRYKRWPQPDEVYSYYLAAASYSGTLSLRFNRQHFSPGYLRGLPAEERQRMRQQYHPPGVNWQFIGRPNTPFSGRDPPRPGFRARHHLSMLNAAHRNDDWVLAVPAWLPMALLVVMPALWLNRHLKARRARRVGLCSTCGYDLRASPEQCPECGALAKVNA